MSVTSDPFEQVKEALLFSTRNLGRLGNNPHARVAGDSNAWRVPDDALEALGAIQAERYAWAAAFSRYGGHDRACERNGVAPWLHPCTCGFDERVEALTTKEKNDAR